MDAAGEAKLEQLSDVFVTVLIAEDDPLIRLVTAEFLREAGLKVVEATSGDEAWSYIESGGRPELLFTDIHMPGRLDGRQLAKLVTQRYPQTHVIVASGNLDPSTGVEFANFLRKPYDFEHASGLVLTLLGISVRGNSDNPSGTDGNSS